jgi:uncharacterized membrane protein YvbJ
LGVYIVQVKESEMKCNKCGTSINIEDKFCGDCGEKIDTYVNISHKPDNQYEKKLNNDTLSPLTKMAIFILFIIALLILAIQK